MECDKAALRDQMRALRASVRAQPLSDAICERVLALPAYRDARTVFLYHSVAGEVDTLKLIDRARADGKTVCLPAIIGKGVMEARRMDRLVPGPYGIPSPEGPVIAPGAIDLLVVPGLAFDRECHRLGRGGGYYDRYLPGCRGTSVGLACDWQVLERLPLEAHDAPLDCVATETTLYIRP